MSPGHVHTCSHSFTPKLSSRLANLSGVTSPGRKRSAGEAEPISEREGKDVKDKEKEKRGWGSRSISVASKALPPMLIELGSLAPLHITLEPAPKTDIFSAGAASANTALQPPFSDANERKRASQIVYATGFVNRLVTPALAAPALRGRYVPHRAARDEVAAAQAARRSHCGGARSSSMSTQIPMCPISLPYPTIGSPTPRSSRHVLLARTQLTIWGPHVVLRFFSFNGIVIVLLRRPRTPTRQHDAHDDTTRLPWTTLGDLTSQLHECISPTQVLPYPGKTLPRSSTRLHNWYGNAVFGGGDDHLRQPLPLSGLRGGCAVCLDATLQRVLISAVTWRTLAFFDACGRRPGPQPHTTRTLSHLDAPARDVHIRSQPTRRAPGCTSFVSLFPAPPCARAPANSTCLTRSKRLRDSARVPPPFLGASNSVCAGTSWRENENTAMGTVRRGMRTMHRGTTATPPSDIYLAHDAGVAHLKFAARTSCGVVGAGKKEECGGVAVPTVAHLLLGNHVPSAVPSAPRANLPALPQHTRRPPSLPQCPIPVRSSFSPSPTPIRLSSGFPRQLVGGSLVALQGAAVLALFLARCVGNVNSALNVNSLKFPAIFSKYIGAGASGNAWLSNDGKYVIKIFTKQKVAENEAEMLWTCQRYPEVAVPTFHDLYSDGWRFAVVTRSAGATIGPLDDATQGQSPPNTEVVSMFIYADTGAGLETFGTINHGAVNADDLAEYRKPGFELALHSHSLGEDRFFKLDLDVLFRYAAHTPFLHVPPNESPLSALEDEIEMDVDNYYGLRV
ncbi:hypothetical protein C8R44DRAFT_892306 [Mycena epipterygia]|nr:hypothetical protein C8R44DRAFT_892306 [Mycena epipterygia]